MFVPLKKILPVVLNKFGLKGETIEAVRVCQYWDEIIEKIFKSRAADISKALYFKNKTLTVSVLNSTCASEFQFKDNEIIKEINQKIGKNLVERINFRVK